MKYYNWKNVRAQHTQLPDEKGMNKSKQRMNARHHEGGQSQDQKHGTPWLRA